MTDLWAPILSAVLGGGIFTAISAMIRSRSERKKLDAEAASVGLKAPIEAESIQVSTMVDALNGARSINDDLSNQVTELKEQFDRAEKLRVQDSESMHRELSGVRRALQAAQDYIESFIAWGHRVAPDEPQPKPPQNYYRTN